MNIYGSDGNENVLYTSNDIEYGQVSLNNRHHSQEAISNNRCDFNNLRPVDEIPLEFQTIFSKFPYFNVIQSHVLNTALHSDDSFVLCAPTGSGKTTVFELAILRYIMNSKEFEHPRPYKIVYIAPIKALCEERLTDWYKKFATFGVTCICVTGDREFVDIQSLINHDLIITTPEKWDSITRRWQDDRNLVSAVKLFLLDEIHLLNDQSRGPTLEAVVCRMKTIHSLLPTSRSPLFNNLRCIAVSGTIPNVEDIAEWISLPKYPAKSFMFGEEMRSVKLQKIVLGFTYNSTPFKFDWFLNYKLQKVILEYSEGKPTLIFCSTRKSAEMTSQYISQSLSINLNPQLKQILSNAAHSVLEKKLQTLLESGVCYHHAGLSLEDRNIIEDLFRKSNLPVLVTTSTLCMGINLPAHLVIIKSTKYYCDGKYQDYAESTLLQMIGRAGRPQFDISATAVILTNVTDVNKFENMLNGKQPIESNLHKHLTNHLNAEIVLNTITDLGVAMQWLMSTFLYIRAKKNPLHYGFRSELTSDQIDKKLLEMCKIEINRLTTGGMITIDQNSVLIEPTMTGLLMAKYCIEFGTMKLFTEVSGQENLQQILGIISKCHEFNEIYLRVNDKKALNLLNKCRNKETIRFPFNSKIKTVDMKINCIIQAVFGCLQILEQSLITESHRIMRIGERISKCLAEYLQTKYRCYSALLNAIILTKCFHVRLWENSPFVSKQLSGIGSAFSTIFTEAKLISFGDLLRSNPRDLERLIRRKPPMGDTILEEIKHLPNYELTFTKELSGKEKISIKLKVCLKNADFLKIQSTINVNSGINILVGDYENNILLYEKYTHSYFIDRVEITKQFDFQVIKDEFYLKAHLISEDWVGIDTSTEFKIFGSFSTTDNNNQKKNSTQKTRNFQKPSSVQTFINSYFKQTKKKNKPKEKQTSNKIKINQTAVSEKDTTEIINISDTSVFNENEHIKNSDNLLEIVSKSVEEYTKKNVNKESAKTFDSQNLEAIFENVNEDVKTDTSMSILHYFENSAQVINKLSTNTEIEIQKPTSEQVPQNEEKPNMTIKNLEHLVNVKEFDNFQNNRNLLKSHFIQFKLNEKPKLGVDEINYNASIFPETENQSRNFTTLFHQSQSFKKRSQNDKAHNVLSELNTSLPRIRPTLNNSYIKNQNFMLALSDQDFDDSINEDSLRNIQINNANAQNNEFISPTLLENLGLNKQKDDSIILNKSHIINNTSNYKQDKDNFEKSVNESITKEKEIKCADTQSQSSNINYRIIFENQSDLIASSNNSKKKRVHFSNNIDDDNLTTNINSIIEISDNSSVNDDIQENLVCNSLMNTNHNVTTLNLTIPFSNYQTNNTQSFFKDSDQSSLDQSPFFSKPSKDKFQAELLERSESNIFNKYIPSYSKSNISALRASPSSLACTYFPTEVNSNCSSTIHPCINNKRRCSPDIDYFCQSNSISCNTTFDAHYQPALRNTWSHSNMCDSHKRQKLEYNCVSARTQFKHPCRSNSYMETRNCCEFYAQHPLNQQQIRQLQPAHSLLCDQHHFPCFSSLCNSSSLSQVSQEHCNCNVGVFNCHH